MNLIQYIGMDVHNDSIAHRITGGRIYSVKTRDVKSRVGSSSKYSLMVAAVEVIGRPFMDRG